MWLGRWIGRWVGRWTGRSGEPQEGTLDVVSATLIGSFDLPLVEGQSTVVLLVGEVQEDLINGTPFSNDVGLIPTANLVGRVAPASQEAREVAPSLDGAVKAFTAEGQVKTWKS